MKKDSEGQAVFFIFLHLRHLRNPCQAFFIDGEWPQARELRGP
jgi:hypothetical protein